MYSAVVVGQWVWGVRHLEKLFTTKERVLVFSKALLEYTGKSPNMFRISDIRRTTGYFVFEQKDMDFEV